jgi:CDP-4-dehydro-6-deoxyglucose reductase
MTFNVLVQPSGRTFECAIDETVLAAALRAGIGLPYGCKNGACGSCKGALLSGEVIHGPHQVKALPEVEELAGKALFCCARPQSDIVIEAREIVETGDFPVRKMPSRVAHMERLTDDVMLLKLQLPATEKMQYRAGQYIEFILKDGRRRSYSIGNAPHIDEQISLHIRHMPGGVFTDHVFSNMKEREILRFEGPLGSFFLREDSNKPIILLASGTGFAPVKAIVEQLIHIKSERTIWFYWGGRRPSDFYMHSMCEQWQQTLPDFRYLPVASNALVEDDWQGRTGFVHQAIMQDFPDMSQYQVYACGAPVVIDSARRDFVNLCNLPKEEFYADSFTSQADAPGT